MPTLPFPNIFAAIFLFTSLIACGDTNQPIEIPPDSPITENHNNHAHPNEDENLSDNTATDNHDTNSTNDSVPLSATFEHGTFEFPEAVYGVTNARSSTSGEVELFVELWHGGFQGCPSDDFPPSPDYTLVLSNIILSSELDTQSTDDGIVVQLFDYTNTILTNSVTEVASQASITILSPMQNESLNNAVNQPISLFLEAQFIDGVIAGHITAQHCAIMDL